MNKSLSYLLALGSLMILNACQQEAILTYESNTANAGFPNVDENLWPYFESFETEALARGIQVDLAGARITGQIEEIHEEYVAGQCSYSSFAPNEVVVDATYWNNSSELFKEFIIFHELGHCYLARDHREDANNRGICLSIMRSGTLNCRDNYNSLTREAYMDELFSGNGPFFE